MPTLLNSKIITLTIIHHPENEKERIASLKGDIYFGRLNGSLAVSRSFGDFEIKGKKGDKLVTADPFISHGTISNGDIIIIASDGLWVRSVLPLSHILLMSFFFIFLI
jgi:serine/threonine protein phosphatase PrpC